MSFERQYDAYREAVETYLGGLFTEKVSWADLYESMRYSLLAGGKRIRPVLTLAFTHLGTPDWRKALPVGCAVELVHTFSLIHDDLPCMDNDDFRRGRPSNHKAYGETLAVLAGDTLLAEAFRLIADAPGLDAETRVQCVRILSEASGASGMAAGQVLDTLHAPQTLEEIREVHRLKTGAMIAGACQLGATISGTPGLSDAAETYGHKIGLAFQIQDDVLDVTADADELGKPVGSDKESGKVTYVDLFGVDKCGELVRTCTEEAISAVSAYDRNGFLSALARSLSERRK
ncbi:MAG: polyprenyl synthetase family protein [Oscillospiraceae bacterium]|nr:polyprenyl synthetase family protein [Oscillospiraceae bacterium]